MQRDLYVPPFKRGKQNSPMRVFRRLGTDHFKAICDAKLLVGPHMTYQGGSWSPAKIAEQLACADRDWAAHMATGIAPGYYWVSFSGERAEAVVGFYRECEKDLYDFRMYTTCSDRTVRAQIAEMALQKFVRYRPEQKFALAYVRGNLKSKPTCTDFGFKVIGEAWLLSRNGKNKRNGKKGRRVIVLFNKLDTVKKPTSGSGSRLPGWMG